MNFVDEEHVTGAKICEDGGQVTSAFDDRAGSNFHVDFHLVGKYMRERGLSQPGRPIKEDVIQCFAAFTRRRDQNRQVVFNLILTDQVI